MIYVRNNDHDPDISGSDFKAHFECIWVSPWISHPAGMETNREQGLPWSAGGRFWDSTSSCDGKKYGKHEKNHQAKCSINGKPIQILVMIIQLLSPYWLGCYQSRYKGCVWLITLPMSCPRCEVQQRLRPNLQICQWLCQYLWAVCCFGGWFLHMLFSIILQLSYSRGVDMATHHVCLVGATCLYILVGCTCESTLVFSLYKDKRDL